MTDIGILITVLGGIGTLCAIIFGYAAFKRNRKEDDTGEGQQKGTLMTEIGYIKSGIDDIKTEQREQRKVNTELYSRMASVEASAKQAHKRLDNIEHHTTREE